MKRILLIIVACLLLGGGTLSAQGREVKLKIVQTSDVHGNYYPRDFMTGVDAGGSLARVSSYVKQQRKAYGDRLILLDNGDILQGQPVAYYYNYMDTTSIHVCAEMLNYLQYDAGNMGNHDVEAGRNVFDRWASQCRFPILGANIIETDGGKTHFPPYIIMEREGVKIAVLGLITPAIPAWLPQSLWPGLRFDDMLDAAERWVKVIQEQEHPDVLIGLFHAGKDDYVMNNKYRENMSVQIAKRIPGFDAVLIGHDHILHCDKVTNVAGQPVVVLNPSNNAIWTAALDITLELSDGKVIRKETEGQLVRMDSYPVDNDFMQQFSNQYQVVCDFVSKPIGRMNTTISTRPAYFGSSAFVDFIHQLQLQISGADISLAAPLSYDAEIKAGEICVSDMFKLYKYENMLYTMRLTGQEVKDALEMSYALWTCMMKQPGDPLLRLRPASSTAAVAERARFLYPSFNFDSAAGIIYTVDVTKPEGQKVTILSMADGSPFYLDKEYRVAVNSYRGNGGGELLTKGSGIPHDELKERIITSTDKDLRYYLMQYIGQQKEVTPKALNQWKFIPEEWVEETARKEYESLFGKEE